MSLVLLYPWKFCHSKIEKRQIFPFTLTFLYTLTPVAAHINTQEPVHIPQTLYFLDLEVAKAKQAKCQHAFGSCVNSDKLARLQLETVISMTQRCG